MFCSAHVWYPPTAISYQRRFIVSPGSFTRVAMLARMSLGLCPAPPLADVSDV